MNDKKYKYDVAFSFVKDDEPLATAINDLIQDRVSAFLYSKRQEEIAGTDGEKTFHTVFGEEARVVVVLFRDAWGTTAWTRIEETAIRNRAYSEGYDFVIFIPVQKEANLPKWLPKTQLWIGLERWGIDGAATVIEARIQQAGGLPKEESVGERAVRLKRQMDAETERKKFLESIEGVDSALTEADALFNAIEKHAQDIDRNAGFNIRINRFKQGIELYAEYGCLGIYWFYSYRNSLDGAYLSIELWNGTPNHFGRTFINKPRELQKELYNFDQEYGGEIGWSSLSDNRFLSSEKLAEHCLKNLIDYIHQEHLRKER